MPMDEITKVSKALSKLETTSKEKVEVSEMIQRILQVVVYLNNAFAREDRKRALDIDQEVTIQMKEVAGNYKSKSVMLVTLGSAALTTAGGFAGLAGAIPGTGAGMMIAGRGGGIFSLFGDAANAGIIQGVGGALDGAGKAGSQVGSVIGSNKQGTRALLEHEVQAKNKSGTRNDQDVQSGKDKIRSTSNSIDQVISSLHAIAMKLLSQSA